MTDALAKILTLQEAMELAKVFADSDLVPKEYKSKPANCVIAIKMGEEVGLSPFQALQSICVINGKPSIYGDAGLGIVMASGELLDMKEEDDGETATCTMSRKGHPNPVTRSFSAADAQRIQMYESDGRGGGGWKPLGQRMTWRNHPKRMRQWRARWWVMRDLFPDVLKGLRGAEEMEEATIIDVTPEPAADEFAGMEPKEVVHEAGRGDTGPEREMANGPHDSGASRPESSPQPDRGSVPVTERQDAPPRGPQPPDNGKESAMAVTDPVAVFELNGVNYQTKGCTKDQMLRLFGLCSKANKKAGQKGYDKHLLETEFGVTSKKDLTEEAAERYAIRLTEVIEAA